MVCTMWARVVDRDLGKLRAERRDFKVEIGANIGSEFFVSKERL